MACKLSRQMAHNNPDHVTFTWNTADEGNLLISLLPIHESCTTGKAMEKERETSMAKTETAFLYITLLLTPSQNPNLQRRFRDSGASASSSPWRASVPYASSRRRLTRTVHAIFPGLQASLHDLVDGAE